MKNVKTAEILMDMPPLQAKSYKGMVRLFLPEVDAAAKLDDIKSALLKIPGSKILMVGGDFMAGASIVLNLQIPVLLLDILSGMPEVLEAAASGENITVKLR